MNRKVLPEELSKIGMREGERKKKKERKKE